MNRSHARAIRSKTHLSAYFDRENERATIPSATQSAIPNREKDPLSFEQGFFPKENTSGIGARYAHREKYHRSHTADNYFKSFVPFKNLTITYV